MIRNYIKIAVRTLKKNPLFSFINIFGLALSMSICMLVLLRVKDQFSYDKFHPNANQTYRIISQLTNEKGTAYRFAATPLPFLGQLTSNYNLIEKATRIYLPGGQQVIANKKSLELHAAFADESFFSIFGFVFKSGNKLSALNAPNSIVLSKNSAERLFGKDIDPVGQTIEYPKWGSFLVTGVLGEQPGKSHIQFDAYLSMSSVAGLERSGKLNPLLDTWDNFNNSYTYVLVKKAVTAKQLENAVAGISTEMMKRQTQKGSASLKFEIQPFNKIILGEELIASIGNTGSRGKVFAEIAISLIILICACFNYTNLSIARSLNRGKEIGIRKVAGARRRNVFTQFIFESVLIALLSFGVAFLLLRLMMDYVPFIQELMPENFVFDWSVFGWFLLFALFAGLLAGVLPAWTLSSFKPVQVLKNLATVKLFGSNNLRKGLIVVQFTLSLVIVIFTLVFSRQFDYMANADPLFNRDNVLAIRLQGTNPTLLASELKKVNGVEHITAVSEAPGKNVSGTVSVKQQPSDEAIGIEYYDVDADFPSVIDLKLLAGNSFPAGATNEKEQYTIINERALEMLKWKTPGEAVGKQIVLNDTVPVRIVGVMKNFYFRGMEWAPGPLLLRNRQTQFNQLLVRTATTNKQVEEAIAGVWKSNYPYQEFKADWLKQKMSERYSAIGMVSMLGFLAFVTITIACLGLLGMVTYLTQTRNKEIGIRKIMGADVLTIMTILSKGFLKLVLIAGAIGLPLGYIAGFFFLNIFSNRVSIGIDIILFSLLGMLVLVLLTIGAQIYRVAAANPVKALRAE